MAALTWIHGTTVEEARRKMESELAAGGHADRVQWKGNAFSASVAWGTMLSLAGHVDESQIVVDKCSGAMGGTALERIRESLQRIFPR